MGCTKTIANSHAPHTEPLEYEYLLTLEPEGQETHLVKDGSRLVKINVREVLSGIESVEKRRDDSSRKTNIYIGGDVKDSNIVAGDEDVIENK